MRPPSEPRRRRRWVLALTLGLVALAATTLSAQQPRSRQKGGEFTLSIDVEVPLADLEPAIFTAAQSLEPFGPSNPPPTFLSRRVEVREARLVGETHLRLMVTSGRVIWDGIAFGRGEEADSLSHCIDLIYVPETQWWKNEERLQLRVLDLRPARERYLSWI